MKLFREIAALARRNRVAVTMAVVGMTSLAASGVASATPPSYVSTAVTTGFASFITALTTYFGLAVGLVLLALGFGVGLRFIVKWVKFAISKS